MGGGAAIAAALGGDAGAMAASRAATAGVTEALGGIASGFDATTGFAAATGAACARVTGFAETVTVVTGFGAIGAASATAASAGDFVRATWKRLDNSADTWATLRGRPSLSKKIERLARAALGKTAAAATSGLCSDWPISFAAPLAPRKCAM
jgi:hypothetical protein